MKPLPISSVEDRRIGQYMRAYRQPRPPRKKTDVWNVFSIKGSTMLGRIVWWVSWRQYVFEPWQHDPIFSAGCLGDLSRFLCELNREHKGGR